MIRNRIKKRERGFTFIEVVLYIALVLIILGAIVPFAWNAVNLGVKSGTEQELYSTARFVSERLKHEIRNANGVGSGSDFGTDFASDNSAVLRLSQSGTSEDVAVSVSEGRIRVSRGGSANEFLQPADTRVESLVFSDLSSGDGATKNISFSLTVASNYPNAGSRQEYQGSVTIKSGAEMRND